MEGLNGASGIKQIRCGDAPWRRKAGVWRLPAALGPSCWWPALWSAVYPPPRARRSEAWSCPSPAETKKTPQKNKSPSASWEVALTQSAGNWNFKAPPLDGSITPLIVREMRRAQPPHDVRDNAPCGVCANNDESFYRDLRQYKLYI